MDEVLKLLPLLVLIVAAVEYLRRINRNMEDLLALQFQALDMLARILKDPELEDDIVARTGRVVRRKPI